MGDISVKSFKNTAYIRGKRYDEIAEAEKLAEEIKGYLLKNWSRELADKFREIIEIDEEGRE